MIYINMLINFINPLVPHINRPENCNYNIRWKEAPKILKSMKGSQLGLGPIHTGQKKTPKTLCDSLFNTAHLNITPTNIKLTRQCAIHC
jgi:hypothetical protein